MAPVEAGPGDMCAVPRHSVSTWHCILGLGFCAGPRPQVRKQEVINQNTVDSFTDRDFLYIISHGFEFSMKVNILMLPNKLAYMILLCLGL